MERNVIYVVAINDRDIYKNIEWLIECVKKRMQKGQAITLEHLKNCSTLKKITLAAYRMEQRFGDKVTKAEREYGAQLIAEYILNHAEEI